LRPCSPSHGLAPHPSAVAQVPPANVHLWSAQDRAALHFRPRSSRQPRSHQLEDKPCASSPARAPSPPNPIAAAAPHLSAEPSLFPAQQTVEPFAGSRQSAVLH